MRQGGALNIEDQAPAVPPLTAMHMAEAVVRAAMVTGELSLLAYRDEQALKGHVAFRGRWVAFAALLSLHPTTPAEVLALPLGCGANAGVALGRVRNTGWWDEGVVHRLFLDLAGADDRRPMTGLEGLHRTVADILTGRIDDCTKGGAGERG